MIKWSVPQEDIITVNTIYAPSTRAPRNIKQTSTERKGEIDSNAIRMGEFNTPLSIMNTAPKLKIDKKTEDLNYTVG